MAQDFRASEATANHLARALRHNTTLTRLTIPRHEISHTVGDFGQGGALQIGAALKSAPRTSFDFELVGLDLSCAAIRLDLPKEAEAWSNGRIIDHFWAMHALRMLAFAMGSHERVGASSPVQELNDECLRLVCIACWGNSDDSFQQEAPPVASAGGEAAGAAVAAGNAAAVVPAKECEREAEDEACGVKMETEC
mmetsp:Transcript_10903/g.25570  ORF Transcript_10903/g.25570 Transcript_10903/m.25570 type:complete len:195 (-) Transcript_10903:74-658(-)